MAKLCKFTLSLLVLVGFCVPQLFAQDLPKGIAPQFAKYYTHAKEVLEQQDPGFLTDFQTLQEEISTINSTDYKAQFEALMRFLPAIENMVDITSFDGWYKDEGYRTLQLEVKFTFFSIDLPTADKEHHTSVMNMFIEQFMLNSVHSEAVRMLTEQELMERHHISSADAQRILNVWDKLHRDWPW